MLVTNVQRHSRDSSSVWISSFLIHSCMIFPVSILILYNSPIKRMLPSDLLRSFISCAWTNRRSVLCQLEQSEVSITIGPINRLNAMYLVLQGDVLLVVLGLGLGQALLVLVLIQILHVVLLKLFLTPAEITNEINLILSNHPFCYGVTSCIIYHIAHLLRSRVLKSRSASVSLIGTLLEAREEHILA